MLLFTNNGQGAFKYFPVQYCETRARQPGSSSRFWASCSHTCHVSRTPCPEAGDGEDTRGNCSLPPVGGAGGGDQPLTSIRYWAGPSPRDSNGISSHHCTPPPDLWQHCWRSHLSRYGRYTYSPTVDIRSPGTRSHEDWVQWVLQPEKKLSRYSHSHIYAVHIVILVILRTQRLP